MAGPWENYQTPAAAQPASGPWLRYQSPAGTPGGYTPASNPADTYRSPAQGQATAGRAPINGQATPAPTDMWAWWNQAHGNETPPRDPRDVLNRWAREAPDQFQAYQDWYQQNYGVPFATNLTGWNGLAWGAGPNYDFNEQAGNPMPQVDMAARTFVNGMTLGNSANLIRLLGGSDQAANLQEQAVEGYHIQNPELAGTLEMAGGALPFMLPGGLARAAGAGTRGVTAAETAGGIAGGAAAGYGYSDPNASPWQIAANMGLNAFLGGVGGRLGAEAGATRTGATRDAIAAEGNPLATTIPERTAPVAANDAAQTAFNPPDIFARSGRAEPWQAAYSETNLMSAAAETRAAARQVYDAIDASGYAVPRQQVDDVLQGLMGQFDQALGENPQARAILDDLINRSAQYPRGVQLGTLERWRQDLNQRISDLWRQGNGAEATLLTNARDAFDDQILALSAYQPAREAWLATMRLDTLSEAATRAADRAGRYGTKSYAEAFRDELARIKNNSRLWNRFSAEQQEAITRAIRDGGPLATPTSFINGLLGGGLQRVLTNIAGSGLAFAAHNPIFALPGALDLAARVTRGVSTRNNLSNVIRALQGPQVPYYIPLGPSAGQVITGGAGAAGAQGLFGFPAPR